MVTPNMKTSCLNYLLISTISGPDHNLSISLVLRCTKMTSIIKTYPLIRKSNFPFFFLNKTFSSMMNAAAGLGPHVTPLATFHVTPVCDDG